ncbi:AAA family ATPase [Amnibacterium sp. CER49]|uniref:AAA family ATPase n=1 Tax=Amnibacterium sp. CER49 TaxID=3039161 RepID=UPI00244C0454|nr:AAA family ATPase [Amnibacterium sp. CER49]MDH2442658.1 AAA family ATPase [Amnibacterium sp. CER49]
MTGPLVVVGGLPGTGKTTVASLVAQRLGVGFIRVDTVEQALRDHADLAGPVGVSGYAVAYALAAEQLALGLGVVVECVNPLRVTRDAWAETGRAARTAALQVELVCSDTVEHRRRIETRTVSVKNLVPPTWHEVRTREVEPWTGERLVLDTAVLSADEAAARVLRRIGTA